MDTSSFAGSPICAAGVQKQLPLYPTAWAPRLSHAPSNPPSNVCEGDPQSGVTHSATPTQPSGDTQASVNVSPPKIRRRNRMITSCLECRRRKLKCDRLQPCSNCSKTRRDCLFLAPATDATSRMKLTELKEKIGSLERSLEEDAAKTQGAVIKQEDRDNEDEVLSQSGGVLDTVVEEGHLPFPDDEKILEPTPLAVQDAAYEDEGGDDCFDLGFRIGKMRMTERIGGLFRPKIADELSVALETLHVSVPPQQQVQSTVERLLPKENGSYFAPSDPYIAPRSDLFFGGSQRFILADFLPTKVAADYLLQRYWLAVHHIAKIVHRPSFETQYAHFWADVSNGMEPPFSLQALVFAALFSAAVSMSKKHVAELFGVSRKRLVDNFQLGTEMAFEKANFLKTAKTQTLQALVMYMIPMCRDEISRAHSVLVGMAVRLAECMGFHRDPEEYDYGPVESHVRRMIWYQLYFLDLKTSELQGPRPAIRREDFSTKFPINMDDTEISTAKTRSIIDMPRWTDMTYTRIRFECQEFRRMLFRDRVRLEKKKVGLTQVIAKIEAFRKATYAKYGPLIHVPDPTPIQKAAQHMLSILLARAYIFVLQRYLNGVAFNVPERLRQIAVTYGTRMLEDSMELETSPELSLWAWYQSAFNPYHVTLLLLMEVWCNPTIQEADRIWRCLDYVFEVSSLAPELCESGKSQDIRRRDTKARLLLTIVRDRMIAYQERRRLKVPTNMADPKTLPPVLERRKSYAASFKTEASDKECESTASQQSQYQTAVPQHGSLAGNISQQYDGQYARPSHLQDILQSQSSFPHPQYYQHYMAAPQPASQPFSQASFFPSSSAHRPSLSSSSSFGLGRASSGDSEKIESQGSGSSKLWFVSDAGLGSAGAAPPMADDAFVAFPTSYQHQDEGGTIPVEIDWVSDPFVSGGVTSFQFQQLPGNSSGYSSRGLPA